MLNLRYHPGMKTAALALSIACSLPASALPPCSSAPANDRAQANSIPYGSRVALSLHGSTPPLTFASSTNSLFVNLKTTVLFLVLDCGSGKVALRGNDSFISVDPAGIVSLRRGPAREQETFQWIEAGSSEIKLMSLGSRHYVRVDPATGALWADLTDPRTDPALFDWKVVERGSDQKARLEQVR